MKGLDWASLRHHYSLIPLFGALGFGMTLSAAYTARLAIQSPDVMWRRRSNPEPWQGRVDEQGNTVRYKFYQGPKDCPYGYTEYGKPAFPPERPPIEKWWKEHLAQQKPQEHHH